MDKKYLSCKCAKIEICARCEDVIDVGHGPEDIYECWCCDKCVLPCTRCETFCVPCGGLIDDPWRGHRDLKDEKS